MTVAVVTNHMLTFSGIYQIPLPEMDDILLGQLICSEGLEVKLDRGAGGPCLLTTVDHFHFILEVM